MLGVLAIKLEDFGQMQARYEALKLPARAGAVLKDATQALDAAEALLMGFAEHKNIKQAFDKLRKNSLLTGKMRASEARTMLLDPSDDFIAGTRRKLAAWRKTMERVSQGEGVTNTGGRDFIPHDAPVALAVAGSFGVAAYLSIIQLAAAELAKIEGKTTLPPSVAELRRCATLLSDCESASGIPGCVR
jgi:hypothetical protein